MILSCEKAICLHSNRTRSTHFCFAWINLQDIIFLHWSLQRTKLIILFNSFCLTTVCLLWCPANIALVLWLAHNDFFIKYTCRFPFYSPALLTTNSSFFFLYTRDWERDAYSSFDHFFWFLAKTKPQYQVCSRICSNLFYWFSGSSHTTSFNMQVQESNWSKCQGPETSLGEVFFFFWPFVYFVCSMLRLVWFVFKRAWKPFH